MTQFGLQWSRNGSSRENSQHKIDWRHDVFGTKHLPSANVLSYIIPLYRGTYGKHEPSVIGRIPIRSFSKGRKAFEFGIIQQEQIQQADGIGARRRPPLIGRRILS